MKHFNLKSLFIFVTHFKYPVGNNGIEKKWEIQIIAKTLCFTLACS